MATDRELPEASALMLSSPGSLSVEPDGAHASRLARLDVLRGSQRRRARRQAAFERPFPPLWRRALSLIELSAIVLVLGVIAAALIAIAAVTVVLVASHLVTA